MASEYLKWKYRDVKPDAPVERTRKQKAANWWHYHRWWLLAGVLLVAALLDIGRSVLGIGAVKPDYQVAYLASVPLEASDAAALEAALAEMGEDLNGDGRVSVQVNAYVDMAAAQDTDVAQYTAAAKVRLMADLENCESYFFILDGPETFHDNYQVLARPDGALAEYADEARWIAWKDCPALAVLNVDQGLFENLYFARRGFWRDRVCANREGCDALWNRLTEGAES